LASNSALCSRFNRLEQLVLQHRSAFARQLEQQPRSSSAVLGNNVTHCIGFGSHQQACTSRFGIDNADVDEMWPKSCSTQWRSEDRPELRMSGAEKNVASVVSETDDVSTSSAVNSKQDCWQNVADLSDVEAWPGRTSVDSQRQYIL